MDAVILRIERGGFPESPQRRLSVGVGWLHLLYLCLLPSSIEILSTAKPGIPRGPLVLEGKSRGSVFSCDCATSLLWSSGVMAFTAVMTGTRLCAASPPQSGQATGQEAEDRGAGGRGPAFPAGRQQTLPTQQVWSRRALRRRVGRLLK